MRSIIKTQTQNFEISADGIPFEEFKDWIANHPSCEFFNVKVNHGSTSTTVKYLDLNSYYDRIINVEAMTLILDAYNELLAQNRVNENNKLNFEKFIVDGEKEHINYLTKTKFRELVKLGVAEFKNIEILDQPFPFNTLALQSGQRLYIHDGVLKIPNDTKLTETEWAMLQSQPIRFYRGSNVTVSPAKKSEPHHPGQMENHAVEYAYKTKSINDFKKRTIVGEVDLSKIQKTKCPAFNIEGTTFNDPLNVCNAVFVESQVKGANFNGGIIFNDNTDFSKWSGNVSMPDNAPIVYINKEGDIIETTVDELYRELKNTYNESRKGFFSRFRSNFITDTLEAKDKSNKALFETNGEKLFKLLQHMQEQKNKWFSRWRSNRTLDTFETVIHSLEKNQANNNAKKNPVTSTITPESSEPIETKSDVNERVKTKEDILLEQFYSIPTEIKKGGFTLASKILKECQETWGKVILNDRITKAILALKKEVYEEACSSKVEGTLKYQRLSLFIQSDLAKNPIVADFIQTTDLPSFTKALPFSIRSKKSLDLLAKNKSNLHFGALANLFITIEEAERAGITHFYDISDSKANGNKIAKIESTKNILSSNLFSGHDDKITAIFNDIIMHEKFNLVRNDGRLINISQDNFPKEMKENYFGTFFNSLDSGYVKYSYACQLQNDFDKFLKLTDPVSISERLSFMVSTLESNLSHMQKNPSDYKDLLPLFSKAHSVIKNADTEYKKNLERFLEALNKERSHHTQTTPRQRKVTVIEPGEEKLKASVANEQQAAALEKSLSIISSNKNSAAASQSEKRQTSPSVLRYSEVATLLKETVWHELLKTPKSIAKLSIKNIGKTTWEFSVEEKNTSTECAHLRTIVATMNKTIAECFELSSTDESRLSALKLLAEEFAKIKKPFTSFENTFYTAIENALAAINNKIEGTEKKLQESKTNPHRLFSHEQHSKIESPTAAAATNPPKLP